MEEKLGIFLYNNKQHCIKTRLILILKNKQHTFACFLIKVVGYFFIVITRAVKKPALRFLFNPPHTFFIKKNNFFSVKKQKLFALCTVDKEILAWFQR